MPPPSRTKADACGHSHLPDRRGRELPPRTRGPCLPTSLPSWEVASVPCVLTGTLPDTPVLPLSSPTPAFFKLLHFVFLPRGCIFFFLSTYNAPKLKCVLPAEAQGLPKSKEPSPPSRVSRPLPAPHGLRPRHCLRSGPAGGVLEAPHWTRLWVGCKATLSTPGRWGSAATSVTSWGVNMMRRAAATCGFWTLGLESVVCVRPWRASKRQETDFQTRCSSSLKKTGPKYQQRY